MSQPASDLPRFVQILGRYRGLIGVMAAVGLLAGAVFAALNPPVFTSRALVLLASPFCPEGAICGGPAFSSGSAGPDYVGARLLQALPGEVQVKPSTGNVLWVSTTAGTAAQAEAEANTAALGYISYADSLSYLGEHASAQLLEPATSATGTPPLRRLLDGALLGAVFGALVGVIAALAGSGTSVDTLPAPPEVGVGEENNRTDREPRYASTAPSLQQMALEYVQRNGAGDRPLAGSAAGSP